MKAELPTIDLTPFLHHGQDHAATCQQVADMLVSSSSKTRGFLSGSTGTYGS